MDPYIEGSGRWRSFHTHYLSSLAATLNRTLPGGYVADIKEYILLGPTSEQLQRFAPDVSIREDDGAPGRDSGGGGAATATAAVAVPTYVPVNILDIDEERQAYLEIQRQADGAVVTTIELLSPGNKREPGLGQLTTKRKSAVLGGVSFVEIDLLLAGERTLAEPGMPAGDYFVMVSHAGDFRGVDVFPWRLEQRLPRVPVPLAGDDPAVPVDLQAVLADVYDRANFARMLDYAGGTPAANHERQTAWAKQVAGRRAT